MAGETTPQSLPQELRLITPHEETFHTYINGPINVDCVTRCLENFQRAWSNPNIKDISLILTSEGGSIEQGFALYDLIKLSNEIEGKPVHITAMQKCMSSAVMVLQAGEGKRIATENTHFMIHEFTFGAPSEQERDALATIEEDARRRDSFIRLTVERGQQQGKLDVVRFKELYKDHQYYFDAHKAVELGLIDEVLLWKKDGKHQPPTTT